MKSLFQNDFLKKVFPLVLGTGTSQFFIVISSPIITRIYNPYEVGILSIYLAIVSALTIITSLRFELALMLPKKNEDLETLLSLGMTLTIFISFILTFPLFFIDFKNNDFHKFFIILFFISLTSSGLYQLFINYLNREGAFKRIAIASVILSITTVLSQIILGFFNYSFFGLILGSSIGALISLMMLIHSTKINLLFLLSKMKIRNLQYIFFKYKEFPFFSTPAAFLNGFALQSPIFFIGLVFESSIAGLYALSLRVVYLPISLISSAAYQVIFKQISELREKNPKLLNIYILRKLIGFFTFAIFPLIIFSFFSEEIFALAFGEEWRTSGKYAVYLAWAGLIKFCINPLMAIFNFEGHVKTGSYWQILYSFSLILTLTSLYVLEVSMNIFLITFVVHEIILYLICLYLINRASLIMKISKENE